MSADEWEQGLAEREREDWFQRLPEAEQERLRDAWRAELARDDRWREGQVQRLRQTLVECSVILAVLTLFLRGAFLLPLLLALFVVGPALGATVHATRAGRFSCAALGLLAFLLVQGLTGYLVIVVGNMFYLLFLAPMVASVFGIYGVRREFRAYPGWE